MDNPFRHLNKPVAHLAGDFQLRVRVVAGAALVTTMDRQPTCLVGDLRSTNPGSAQPGRGWVSARPAGPTAAEALKRSRRSGKSYFSTATDAAWHTSSSRISASRSVSEKSGR